MEGPLNGFSNAVHLTYLSYVSPFAMHSMFMPQNYALRQSHFNFLPTNYRQYVFDYITSHGTNITLIHCVSTQENPFVKKGCYNVMCL